MINTVKHIPLVGTYCCNELSDRRILVSGNKFIKVFSLETYEEIKDIQSDSFNWNSLVIPERNMVFIATYSGLYRYSLPELALVQVHEPYSSVYCLAYLKSKDIVLFTNWASVLSLNLNDSAVSRLEDGHTSYINSLASTLDEKFVLSTGRDKTLKQWSTDSWSVVKSVDVESDGMSLLLDGESGTVLVGMEGGSLAEYSLGDLSLIRTLKLHTYWIRRVIKLSSGDIMTCFSDGKICLPFGDNLPIEVSNGSMYSITELSDNKIACCCYNGVKIILSPVQNPRLVESPQTISATTDPISSTLDSLSSSIDSIKASTSDQKTQLVSLLQHHLSQLLIPAKHQPEKFTGLTLSLLPDLKSIQRSYCYEGLPEGRKKILSQNYTLEVISLKSIIPESEAIVTFFDRKLRLLGKISDPKNPLDSFKIKQMRRGKWVFIMNDQTDISGPARVNFTNGYLDCFTFDGCLTDRSGFQATLAVDGVIKEVVSIGNDGMVVTSDRRGYFLNLERNTIEDL